MFIIKAKKSLVVEVIDFYELLGISKNASNEAIKTAYRSMVKKYHPDINKTEEAEAIIRSLNEAKDTLLNEEKRKEYDKTLDEIKYSKQFSSNKESTYKAKKEKYKENYADAYLTRWQFFIYYLKQSQNKIIFKFLKSLLVGINFSIFLIIKGIIFGVLFVVYLFSDFIDYAIGLFMLIALLGLFFLSHEQSPDIIPLLPANIEFFGLISIGCLIIGLLKNTIITKSINLYALIQDWEDFIFLKILN